MTNMAKYLCLVANNLIYDQKVWVCHDCESQ